MAKNNHIHLMLIRKKVIAKEIKAFNPFIVIKNHKKEENLELIVVH